MSLKTCSYCLCLSFICLWFRSSHSACFIFIDLRLSFYGLASLRRISFWICLRWTRILSWLSYKRIYFRKDGHFGLVCLKSCRSFPILEVCLGIVSYLLSRRLVWLRLAHKQCLNLIRLALRVLRLLNLILTCLKTLCLRILFGLWLNRLKIVRLVLGR